MDREEKRVVCAYQEDVLKLVHVVDALGEELGLDLVNDLVHAVSPVCHCSFSFLTLSVSLLSVKDALFSF